MKDLKQQFSQLRQSLDSSIYFDDDVDLLTFWKLKAQPTSTFIFAQISSIDYKNCMIAYTLQLIREDGDPEINSISEFKYQYKKND